MRLNIFVKLNPNEKATLRHKGGEDPVNNLPIKHKKYARRFYIDIIIDGNDKNDCAIALKSNPLTVSSAEKYVQVFVKEHTGADPNEGGVGNYEDPDGEE